MMDSIKIQQNRSLQYISNRTMIYLVYNKITRELLCLLSVAVFMLRGSSYAV